ncbi:MAG: NAD(P) transhydrogenase subunit alpha [Candidatus Nanopelagicales bacterium]|jgi:NAD(P) transhydrogenase subunit alpha|nr:NAD(P) transhydrogenase subunit alpha [Candidatus Nanopelagicales bacterium]
MDGIALLTIFILSIFVGFEVVSKVSAVLHTPLMSGANAIHGVVVMGAIIVAGKAQNNVELAIALIAVLLGAINLVGGFVVTDRMLEMFKPKKAPAAKEGGAA